MCQIFYLPLELTVEGNTENYHESTNGTHLKYIIKRPFDVKLYDRQSIYIYSKYWQI